MIIISTDAEEKLMQWINDDSTKQHSPRAIHIPAVEMLYEAETEQLTEAATDHFSAIMQDSNARLFICLDRDIIIAGSGITTQHYKKIALYLTEQLAQAPNFTTFYEHGCNWHQCTSLFNVKFEALEAKRNAQEHNAKQLKKEKIRQAALNQDLPKEMLGNFAQRRADRERLEILVVEDDPFSRTLVDRSLKGIGVISTVENGHQAIAAFVQKAPDVLFLDIDLPDISGHEVLRKILEIDPNAYVIMLSGNGDQKNVVGAIKNGAKGFVAKPFAKEKLLAYIQKAPTYKAPVKA